MLDSINLSNYNTMPEQVEENKCEIAKLKHLVTIGYNPRGKWVSGVSYEPKDSVYLPNGMYVCIEQIIDSTISPDLDEKHWVVLYKNDYDARITNNTTEIQANEARIESNEDSITTISAALKKIHWNISQEDLTSGSAPIEVTDDTFLFVFTEPSTTSITIQDDAGLTVKTYNNTQASAYSLRDRMFNSYSIKDDASVDAYDAQNKSSKYTVTFKNAYGAAMIVKPINLATPYAQTIEESCNLGSAEKEENSLFDKFLEFAQVAAKSGKVNKVETQSDKSDTNSCEILSSSCLSDLYSH